MASLLQVAGRFMHHLSGGTFSPVQCIIVSAHNADNWMLMSLVLYVMVHPFA
jgi:hypothetical protein